MPIYTQPPSTKRIYPSWVKRVVWWLLGYECCEWVFLRWLLRRGKPAPVTNSVVILEPFGMGDVVALQPLVWALCEEGKAVTVICREAWIPILRPHDNLRTVRLRQDFKFIKHFFQLLAVLWRSRTSSSVTGIDPRGDIRSVMAFWYAGYARVETLDCYFTANDCPNSRYAATVVHPVDRAVDRYKVNQVFTTLPL